MIFRAAWNACQSRGLMNPNAGLGAGFYDVAVAFDHHTGQAWIVSQGFPESDSSLRHRRAQARAAEFQKLLDATSDFAGTAINASAGRPKNIVAREKLAAQFPVGYLRELTSNFSRDDYLTAIRRVIDYIYAGDIFQVNLAQRLLYPTKDDSASLYLRLREQNPAPFAAYFDLGDFQIVSASPERFLQVRDGYVENPAH